MKAGIERPADGLHVTGARGFEDALAGALVDMRFELSPAREAVGACDAQLRIAEPGVGIVAPQCLQQALGLVTKVLEIGASGPAFLARGKAPRCARMSAVSGRKSG